MDLNLTVKKSRVFFQQMIHRLFYRINFLSLFFILLFAQQSFPASIEELKGLYDKKQYFDLRDRLREFQSEKSIELIFYRGAVANKFNASKDSIKLLNHYLKNASPKDEHLKECYSLLADNYVKTYQYAKAADTYKKLLRDFANQLDKEDKADYENVAKLWGALSNVPPQKIGFKGNSIIQGVQEPLGLTVPLEINGNKKEFLIFDTGANLSTVTESLAQKLKLQIIETQIDVTSITGEKVKAKLGIAKKLKLGNATAQNVVFIIFPDVALYIKPIPFQINGFIGFPLIEALRKITWTRNNTILISANPQDKSEQNLALDGLTPLIEGSFDGKRMAFGFDTGASNSSLYPPFFKAFEAEITKNGMLTSEKITGVGGSKEIKAYLMKDLKMNFAGKDTNFAKVEILTEKTTDSSQYFYGNIGRDLIEQFEKMTLNFQTMSVIFE